MVMKMSVKSFKSLVCASWKIHFYNIPGRVNTEQLKFFGYSLGLATDCYAVCMDRSLVSHWNSQKSDEKLFC